MPPTSAPIKPPPVVVAETTSTLRVDDGIHKVIEIRAAGDVILDVTFENTKACTKSIPSDGIAKFRGSKSTVLSTQVFYRVRLETLKRASKYFTHLLGSDVFGEGRAIKEAFTKLASLSLQPSEIDAENLPRIKIVDEDDATRTIGREHVFRDMLRIIHGAEHLTKPVNMAYLSVLVIMADRFDCLALVQRYVIGTFGSFKYPLTLDKNTEETLRMKILIFYHTNQAAKFAAATKELILRGSSRWTGYEESKNFTTAWWELPDGLENELAHRRALILRTLASVQQHFLSLYTSRTRQCALGYDSSPACDSFQLGEMIKFLTKKNLLTLVPFQAASPYDSDYIWPEAYNGDIESIIGLLRQCPSYQIDKNHGHCGLRSRILPSLEYIKDCLETGVGIKVMRWKTDRAVQTWAVGEKREDGNGNVKRPFVVGGEAVGEENGGTFFDFTKKKGGMELVGNSMSVDKVAKEMFTAANWCWTATVEDDGMRPPKSSPSLKF